MKKILFYSLVDWDWIKQRPQFIALGLAELGFQVRGMYILQYCRKGLQKTASGKVQLRPVYHIPSMGRRFAWINRANQWIVQRRVAKEIRSFQPDILWLTHPSQLLDVPDAFCGQVIYDCMDDYDALGTQSEFREKMIRQEQALCCRADCIFVSSMVLQKKICSRNPEKADKVHLVRNGCNGQLYPRVSVSHEGKICAGYVGTIAEWFDFELLLESLKRIPELEYFLIGPVCIPNPPQHKRIHYLGTVAHDSLYEAIKDMDCLVMPFCLNDIVRAVDPVKLYEYISWQKNIITVDYPEISRFGRFVHTYTNADEYCNAVVRIGELPEASFTETEAVSFLANNSWQNRIERIGNLLGN